MKGWLKRVELAEAVQSKLNSGSTKCPYPGAVKDCIDQGPVVILDIISWVSVVQEEWIRLLSREQLQIAKNDALKTRPGCSNLPPKPVLHQNNLRRMETGLDVMLLHGFPAFHSPGNHPRKGEVFPSV